MTATTSISISPGLGNQASSAHTVSKSDRDNLIISEILLDGVWVVASRYADDAWRLTGGPTNVSGNRKRLDFMLIPKSFRAVVKEIMYRYMRRGREGSSRPSTSTVQRSFQDLLPFLHYLEKMAIHDFGKLTPIICLNYVAVCKDVRQHRKDGSPSLSKGTLEKRFTAVEFLYELSHYSSMPFRSHPWPDTSAKHLAGRTGSRALGATPIVPDDAFTALFQAAWKIVKESNSLLSLRDGLIDQSVALQGLPPLEKKVLKTRFLSDHGWNQGLRRFTTALTEISTACYIVIASLSGCRNHELAYLRSHSFYSSEDDCGEIYWWMRSQSDKTGAGSTEWMIPEAAVEALGVMDRWSAPLQLKLLEQIEDLRKEQPLAPEIAEMQRHSGAVFLTTQRRPGTRIQTQTNSGWNMALKAFSKRHNIKWNFATHHFRRKFANYAARSRFGDLRYLREHFKHWSQDMTNDSYALNDHQEIELYADIQDELADIKLGTVRKWLEPDSPLAGGYGKNLVAWRSRGESIALFKDHATMVRSIAESHAIRSNGHAWCTADDQKCIGNSFDRTRCGSCGNAVIDTSYASFYQRSYDELCDLLNCDDIGPGGEARVRRDLARCREVLISLGHNPERDVA